MNGNRRAVAVISTAALALALAAPATAQDASVAPDGHLARILEAGVIRMSTDPAYPPQSELVDGVIVGFDIDVGTEIAKRLGVELDLETPDWALVSAGSWSDRWDFSVGSMTITSARQEHLDFTQPYYFTPAQLAAHADTGITSLDGLAGKTICMGEGTTYLEWMNGTLDFGTETPGRRATRGLHGRDTHDGPRLRPGMGPGPASTSRAGWHRPRRCDDAIADGLPDREGG